MSVSPRLRTAVAVATIAAIAAASGIGKFVQPAKAVAALGRTLTFIDLTSIERLVYSVAGIEVSIACFLAFHSSRKPALRVATALGGVFAVLAVRDAWIGNTTGCGCFGSLAVLDTFNVRVALIGIWMTCCIFLLQSTASASEAPA